MSNTFLTNLNVSVLKKCEWILLDNIWGYVFSEKNIIMTLKSWIIENEDFYEWKIKFKKEKELKNRIIKK